MATPCTPRSPRELGLASWLAGWLAGLLERRSRCWLAVSSYAVCCVRCVANLIQLATQSPTSYVARILYMPPSAAVV